VTDHVSAELWRTYQEIFDLVPVGVHIIDRQGRTRVYNRVMGEIDGYDPAQAMDRSLFELYQLTEDTSTLWKALTTGKPVPLRRQVYFSRNGRRIVTRNRTKPIVYRGEVIGAVEIAQPVAADPARDSSNGSGTPAPGPRTGRATGAPRPRLHTLDDILGVSPAIERARDIARRAARTASTVLIYGETGVGKELFAQGIHSASPRQGGPFIAQNCAALPSGLLEGLLFGTRRGGFTGAVDRPGLFELADGGTLLFDEIHTLDAGLQAKLLRVLQERAVLPVGGTREVPVDVRVMATLNVHPREALDRGLLREDLFYRLSVVHIHVPPLRERREDIPLLIPHFVRMYSRRYGIEVPGVEPEVLRWCMAYDWPGNVRQLEHIIEGAINLADPGHPIAMDHIRAVSDLADAPHRTTGRTRTGSARGADASTPRPGRAPLSKEALAQAFQQCAGNVSATARLLGVSRQRVQYYLRKYQLR
jgi:arginine utilization regulatory protein